MYLDLFYILLGALMLWFGAGWIVDSASAVARRFNVSELVIGLTVVAMGTSAPEFLVTAVAAFKGMADISLANVVGSNTFNLGFILGLMALISPIPTNRQLVWRDGLVLWLTTIVITLMALNLHMARWEGAVLLGLGAGYLVYLFFSAKRMTDSAVIAASQAVPGLPPEGSAERQANWLDGIKLLVGFATISVGSSLLVESASNVAVALGVSKWAVGLTIVAAGTSLPELVTSLAASVRGKTDMLLGNLIGSDFLNFAGVLGLTCLLRPLDVTANALPSLYVLVGTIFTVLVFMRLGWRVTRLEGLLLLLVNLGRWAMELSKASPDG